METNSVHEYECNVLLASLFFCFFCFSLLFSCSFFIFLISSLVFLTSYFIFFCRVSDAINDANEWALEEAVIQQAEKLLIKLELTQDLLNDTAALHQCLPIRSQTTYVQNAHKLERTICRAEKIQVEEAQIKVSRDLILR